MRLKRLLYMSEHPPSQVGGAPIIARQHLLRYEHGSLHVLCDDYLYRSVRDSNPEALLPCAHTTVANLEPILLRPRRLFSPLFNAVNLARIPIIKRKARRIIEGEGTEALLTVPWRTDFALAAYQLSCETNLPLYVFETDDWQAMNQGPVVARITRRWHGPLLSRAEHLWVTSPQMAQRYRERFGVDGDFLFHFVDPELYLHARRREPAVPDELRLVYTGAVNTMFLGALERIAQWLNEGMTVNGRRVVLDVWGKWCPDHLCGPGLRWRGFVPSQEVPGILAGADALLIAITFSETPALRDLVRSSLYTKTIDYLASGKPVVVVSPHDTAEVDYFGAVVWLVDSLDRDQFERAIREATESSEGGGRVQAGLELVRSHHTAATMGERFLSKFRASDELQADGSCTEAA